jgi:hypothetical protein
MARQKDDGDYSRAHRVGQGGCEKWRGFKPPMRIRKSASLARERAAHELREIVFELRE